MLIVDDEQDNIDAFRFNFKRAFSILSANSGPEALELLEDNDVAVIVTDQRMPKMTGVELLKAAEDKRPDAVGIILTAFTEVDVLIEAINLGHIYRYITKPWDAKEVRGVLTQAIERFDLVRENRRMREQLEDYTGYLNNEIHGAFDFGAIVGDSPALREVLQKVEQVAPTDSTVLLRGETGTELAPVNTAPPADLGTTEPPATRQTAEPQPAATPAEPCDTPPSLTLDVRAAAITYAIIESPCHKGTVAELAYSGLNFAIAIDEYCAP